MPHLVVIGGDGIGPEVTAAAVAVLHHLDRAHGLGFRVTHLDLGADRWLAEGVGLPDDAFRLLRDEADAILVGALGDPRVPDHAHAREILLGLRTRLDLYANVRPVALLDARRCPLKGRGPEDLDAVVLRENTEGLYAGIGGQLRRATVGEVAIETEVNTATGVRRILREGFRRARARRGRLCMADKANALRHGHDLWQRAFAELAAEHPDVDARHLYIDTLVMELVRAPQDFDVIVTNNLFGDIVSDLGAELQGGIGLAASANLNLGGEDGAVFGGRRHGLFEPVHGSAPTLAGLGVANPMAAVRSVGMMLDFLGWPEHAVAIEQAVRGALLADEVTQELGGALTTAEVTAALIARLGPGTPA